MMRRFAISRDVLFLILLLLALVALTTFVAVRQAQQDEANANSFMSFSSHSAAPDGLLALHNWLENIGYRPQRIENEAFRVGEDVSFLFIISPGDEISRNEALYLENWVERGHTLFVADNGFLSNNAIFTQLGVKSDFAGDSAGTTNLTQPLVNATMGAMDGEVYSALQADGNDFVPYASGEKPVLLKFNRGQGTIWLASVPQLLTNDNLHNDNNARFVLGLVGNLPRGSIIAFDEYHHGLNAGGEQTFLYALYTTPWGWGLIFAFLLCFGYLIWNGKRFGRTIPVRRTLARRTPSEYVVSMANLFRRANKRGMVLQHYKHALKRRLGRTFHLNPDLSDERYLEMLTKMRPDLDRAELARILNNLRRAETSEMDLVTIVEQAVTFGRANKQNQ